MMDLLALSYSRFHPSLLVFLMILLKNHCFYSLFYSFLIISLFLNPYLRLQGYFFFLFFQQSYFFSISHLITKRMILQMNLQNHPIQSNYFLHHLPHLNCSSYPIKTFLLRNCQIFYQSGQEQLAKQKVFLLLNSAELGGLEPGFIIIVSFEKIFHQFFCYQLFFSIFSLLYIPISSFQFHLLFDLLPSDCYSIEYRSIFQQQTHLHFYFISCNERALYD